MPRNNGQKPTDGQTEIDRSTVRASVALDLTTAELDNLIELCAANDMFRLGMQLAERKGRLRANVSRMAKDMKAAADAAAA